MEFTSRESKFEKEQKARKEAIKKKKAEDERKQRLFRQKEAELEVARAKMREETEARKEQDELDRLEEEALTGGINFNVGNLIAYPIEGEDDKVILPESALQDLSQLDVFGRMPVLLRLFKPDGKYRHVGVREFSAPAGKIGLPECVVFTLTGGRRSEDIYKDVDDKDADAKGDALQSTLGALAVKLVKMPKCTYAKLQPLHNSFSQVKPVRDMLEENLRFHSTLSVGDLVTVWYRGVPHALRVCELQPEEFGSLLDTDVTIDLDVSEEFKNQQDVKSGSSGSSSSSGSNSRVIPQVLAPANAGTAPVIGEAIAATTVSGAIGASSNGNVLGRKEASVESTNDRMDIETSADSVAGKYTDLPEEPAHGESETLTARLKLSSGGSITRRMRRTEAIGFLFHLAARELSVEVQTVVLTTRFPARTLSSADTDRTFASLDISGQETFFVAVK
jgi:hypothetical protein